MSNSNNCQEYLELLDAYLDGELNAEEKSMVEKHLLECTACSRQLNETSQLIHELKALPAKTMQRQLDFSFLDEAKPEDNCHPILELLDAYHDGELDQQEQSQVKSHLDACSSCSNSLARITELVVDLKSLPRVQPSKDIVASIDFSKIDSATNNVLVLQPKANVLPFTAAKTKIGIFTAVAAAAALIFAINFKQAPGGIDQPVAIHPDKAPQATQQIAQTTDHTNSASKQSTPSNTTLEVASTKDNSKTDLPIVHQPNLTASPEPKQRIAAQPKTSGSSKPVIQQEVLQDDKQNMDSVNEIAMFTDSSNGAGADALGISTDEDGLYDIKI